MKKWIHAAKEVAASETELEDYTVEVNFAGMVGADETYQVTAKSAEDAINEAEEEAKDELTVEDYTEIDYGEWEVEIGFAGLIGVSNTYTVSADNEDDATNQALEEAAWDLEGTISEE